VLECEALADWPGIGNAFAGLGTRPAADRAISGGVIEARVGSNSSRHNRDQLTA